MGWVKQAKLKRWKTVENSGKVYRNFGKLWKILENFGKRYSNFGKLWKISDDFSKPLARLIEIGS